jgi:hypothetical protein
MPSASTRAIALACLLAINLTGFPLSLKADDSIAPAAFKTSGSDFKWTQSTSLGAFARRIMDGRAVCLEASAEQARIIRERDSNLIAVSSDSNQPAAQKGLKIMLRAAPQLQSFPLAVEAFKRAAARWEAMIQTEVVIVIDVDFGPTIFGEQFDDKTVSLTDAQALRGNSLYPAIRAGLISEGSAISLYNSLPAASALTDRGAAQAMTASSATLRALGLINQVADPDGEAINFGAPPAIGLNSKFDFDFNPDDGIDAGKLDFESLALHDIGHALGFISSVGQQEIAPAVEVEPCVWDLFRVRPDAIKGDFAAAERILSSGGEQSFYAGDRLLGLSTGRPDGAGGDSRQPSHWKDNDLSGQYTGVMDPTIKPGERQAITENDASAINAIGYKIRSADPLRVPLISGRAETGGMIAPPANLGVFSRTQYSIDVPQDAAQLKIDLNGNQDVDLFVRYGQRVILQGHNPTTDYMSTTEESFESITITPASALPLRAGVYYIAMANFGPGEASFTVTANVTGGTSNGHINRPPAIFNLYAQLEGDNLKLNWAGSDCNGDFAMAEAIILDEAGRAVSSLSRFAINSGDSTEVKSEINITGLSAIAQAARASVALIDRAGNRSPEAIFDFSKAQPGGLALTGASFDQSKLTLKARGIADGLELEINGAAVAPPRKIKTKKSGGKLVISGSLGQLNLRQGMNRIRVKNINGWSNIFLLNL